MDPVNEQEIQNILLGDENEPEPNQQTPPAAGDNRGDSDGATQTADTPLDPFSVVTPPAEEPAPPAKPEGPTEFQQLMSAVESGTVSNKHFKALTDKAKADVDAANKAAADAQARITELEKNQAPEGFDPSWQSQLENSAAENAELKKQLGEAQQQLRFFDVSTDPAFMAEVDTKPEATTIANVLQASNVDAAQAAQLAAAIVETTDPVERIQRLKALQSEHDLDNFSMTQIDSAIQAASVKIAKKNDARNNTEQFLAQRAAQQQTLAQQAMQQEHQQTEETMKAFRTAAPTIMAKSIPELYDPNNPERQEKFEAGVDTRWNRLAEQITQNPNSAATHLASLPYFQQATNDYRSLAITLAKELQGLKKAIGQSGDATGGSTPPAGNAGGVTPNPHQATQKYLEANPNASVEDILLHT